MKCHSVWKKRHKYLLQRSILQGEYSVKLEMSNCTVEDKGTYKLIAKNEKGEAQSQTVTITEIPGNAPAIAEKLQSVVSQIWFFRNLSKFECQYLRIFFSIIFAHIHAGNSMLSPVVSRFLTCWGSIFYIFRQ